mmetsp:Transcript_74659/g.228447  ORF Transcript_74659/g.228447 Transcript_74659/m.228447 type:complete len:313 (+) Transcript_74659:528-1466(+)
MWRRRSMGQPRLRAHDGPAGRRRGVVQQGRLADGARVARLDAVLFRLLLGDLPLRAPQLHEPVQSLEAALHQPVERLAHELLALALQARQLATPSNLGPLQLPDLRQHHAILADAAEHNQRHHADDVACARDDDDGLRRLHLAPELLQRRPAGHRRALGQELVHGVLPDRLLGRRRHPEDEVGVVGERHVHVVGPRRVRRPRGHSALVELIAILACDVLNDAHLHARSKHRRVDEQQRALTNCLRGPDVLPVRPQRCLAQPLAYGMPRELLLVDGRIFGPLGVRDLAMHHRVSAGRLLTGNEDVVAGHPEDE